MTPFLSKARKGLKNLTIGLLIFVGSIVGSATINIIFVVLYSKFYPSKQYSGEVFVNAFLSIAAVLIMFFAYKAYGSKSDDSRIEPEREETEQFQCKHSWEVVPSDDWRVKIEVCRLCGEEHSEIIDAWPP